MANNHPTKFLHLSTELRLEVYKSVIHDCLASGNLSGLVGIFLACRKIHEELQLLFTTRVLTLLAAQHTWIKTCCDDTTVSYRPLRLASSLSSLFSTAGTPTLTIGLPEPIEWSEWPRFTPKWRKRWNDMPCLEEIPSFKQFIAGIRPILRLQWAELNVDLCCMLDPRLKHKTHEGRDKANEQSTTDVFDASIFHVFSDSFREEESRTRIHLSQRIAQGFARALAYMPDDGVCNLSRVDRFVLNYSLAHESLTDWHCQVMLNDFQYIWKRTGSVNMMAKPRRGWIGRKRVGNAREHGYRLAFDYQDNLDDLEGAFLRLFREDRKWLAKPLFDQVDRWKPRQLESGYETGED